MRGTKCDLDCQIMNVFLFFRIDSTLYLCELKCLFTLTVCDFKQVFDISLINPLDFVRYGLASLEHLAWTGDYCAKEIRNKLRIMVYFQFLSSMVNLGNLIYYISLTVSFFCK